MIPRKLLLRCVGSVLAGIAAMLTAPSSFGAQVNGVFAVESATIIDLFSATFDGALDPNCPAAPDVDECSFFSGFQPPGRAIVFSPQLPNTASGSLDVEYDDVTGEILQINRLLINLPDQILTISGATVVNVVQGNATPVPNDTIFAQSGLDAVNGTADADQLRAAFMPPKPPLVGPGTGLFEHDDAPNGDVPDFATFNDIVDSCTGPLCALIPILTLDGVRYRVIGTINSGGADSLQLQTQTANNSIYKVDFATAAVVVMAPEITVTDSVAPAGDLMVPFGSVTELTTANRTVTVTNDGNANLNIGTLGNPDPLAAPFSLAADMCSGQSLAPAASCNVTVSFSPTATGAVNDTFNIPSDDADEASVTVAVSGTGTAMPVPDIDVTDSIVPADDLAVPFGSVTINQSATPATITVTNNGNAALNVGQIAALTAPFAIAGDNCSNTAVMPAMTCTLMVTFMPTVTGPFNDTATIPSDDPDSPNVAVAISGTGAAAPTPDINVMGMATAFGVVTIGNTSTQTVVVANDGTADLVIGSVAAADPLAAPFSVAADGCSNQTLASMASCMIDLSFAPTAVGAANDSLDVPSNDPDEASVTVSVSGTGADPVVTAAVPTSPTGSDSGFFGSADPLSLAAMLVFLILYRVGYRRGRGRH